MNEGVVDYATICHLLLLDFLYGLRCFLSPQAELAKETYDDCSVRQLLTSHYLPTTRRASLLGFARLLPGLECTLAWASLCA